MVIGANGQLGMELQAIAPSYPQYNFFFPTKEILPIENTEVVRRYFQQQQIDLCINCAAFTAVDKAETEKEKAFLVNGIAVGELATICKTSNTQLIHISTDYVYAGDSNMPYKETDPTNPINSYGESKLKGEQLALQNDPSAIIIRTSWLYSSYGNNFVKTMLRLMKERDSINVVNDQYGCPTYAANLANAILVMIDQLAIGNGQWANEQPLLFNYCNSGTTTWFEFALAIKELSISNCNVNPILTSEYPTAAKRPQYSVLDTSKIQQIFDISIPAWRSSLEKCIEKLMNGE